MKLPGNITTYSRRKPIGFAITRFTIMAHDCLRRKAGADGVEKIKIEAETEAEVDVVKVKMRHLSRRSHRHGW